MAFPIVIVDFISAAMAWAFSEHKMQVCPRNPYSGSTVVAAVRAATAWKIALWEVDLPVGPTRSAPSP